MAKKVIMIGLVSLVIVVIASATFFYAAGSQAEKAVRKNPGPQVWADGVYEGVFAAFHKLPVSHVRFTVADGHLVNFNIIRVLSMPPRHPRAGILKAAGNQGLHFDAVSGATVSSRLVQAAIACALKKSG